MTVLSLIFQENFGGRCSRAPETRGFATNEEGRPSPASTVIAYRASRRSVFVYGFAKGERDNIDDGELDDLKRSPSTIWATATRSDGVEAGGVERLRRVGKFACCSADWWATARWRICPPCNAEIVRPMESTALTERQQARYLHDSLDRPNLRTRKERKSSCRLSLP